MRVYHTTTAEAATAILRDGCNGVTAFFGKYALASNAVPFTGVWVADQPVGSGRAQPATLAWAIRCWASK